MAAWSLNVTMTTEGNRTTNKVRNTLALPERMRYTDEHEKGHACERLAP